ncbi:HAD family hydrolase [Streptomyces sp. NPDC002659]|uniref:HAD family hydrolase n=1 Tax=Streptomyces sp. NPDC002659 TaxID=3364656 RepID=UPI0036BB1136
MLALFDLDNTLIDRQGGLEDWVRDFARSRCLPPGAASVIVGQLRDRAFPTHFVKLRDAFALRDSAEELWHEYVDGMASATRCVPGAREGLLALRRAGWKLGLVTNGAGDIQRAKLEKAGLADTFHGTYISEEVGVRKPGRALFETAAAGCGRTLSAGGWMIGDNPETDIEGGRAAGLRTIWIAAGRQWPSDVPPPDVVVKDAREAIAWLAARPR